jgi:serine/threonine-protein kinase HipA
MNRPCLICLEDVTGDRDYHPRCLKDLFGAPRLPTINVEVAKLHTLALAMVGKTTLSGIQRKVSLALSVKKTTLQLAVGPGCYLLKPQAQTYPATPENEHLTMRLAALVGIQTPPFGLIRLPDATLAYIVARFDRPKGGGKLRQEDFCQLSEQPPKDRYHGSAELCARIVKQYATEPLVELVKLYRLMVYTWWAGNGDMHLKNLSLTTGADGFHRLSPAYDQVCTRLVIDNDDLALPIGGKQANLTRRTWLNYAEYCGIPERAAKRILSGILDLTSEAVALVSRSFLTEEMQDAFRETLTSRSQILAG